MEIKLKYVTLHANLFSAEAGHLTDKLSIAENAQQKSVKSLTLKDNLLYVEAFSPKDKKRTLTLLVPLTSVFSMLPLEEPASAPAKGSTK